MTSRRARAAHKPLLLAGDLLAFIAGEKSRVIRGGVGHQGPEEN